MNYWEKKIGLITGASSGLGLEIAAEFSRNEGLPILVARNRDRLIEAQKQLADQQLRSDYIVADVSDSAQAKRSYW